MTQKTQEVPYLVSITGASNTSTNYLFVLYCEKHYSDVKMMKIHRKETITGVNHGRAGAMAQQLRLLFVLA